MYIRNSSDKLTSKKKYENITSSKHTKKLLITNKNGNFWSKNIIELKNYTLVKRAYRTKNKSKKGPATSTVMNIVNNFQKSGSVDRKRVLLRKRTVRTDDLINSIKNLVIEDLTLSLNKIANVVPASVSTIRNVLRDDLNRKPYKKNLHSNCCPPTPKKDSNSLNLLKEGASTL